MPFLVFVVIMDSFCFCFLATAPEINSNILLRYDPLFSGLIDQKHFWLINCCVFFLYNTFSYCCASFSLSLSLLFSLSFCYIFFIFLCSLYKLILPFVIKLHFSILFSLSSRLMYSSAACNRWASSLIPLLTYKQRVL